MNSFLVLGAAFSCLGVASLSCSDDEPAGSGGSGGPSTGGGPGNGGGGAGEGGGGQGGVGGDGGMPFCQPQSTIDCYTGPAGTQDVGLCEGGYQICNEQGTAYGSECVGEVTPAAEICASPDDESCNGADTLCGDGHQWSIIEQGPSARDVAERAGAIVLGGHYYFAMTLGTETITSGSVAGVGFVAKLAADGSVDWLKSAGDATGAEVEAVDIDAGGNVLIAGQFEGSLDLGNGALTSAGAHDLFVAKLDPTGAAVWSRRFGSAFDEELADMAVGPSGEVVLSTTLAGAVDFGGGARDDIVLVKLDSDGNHVWSSAFDQTNFVGSTGVSRAVAVDGSGQIALGGSFNGDIDFGGGTLAAGTNFPDAFLAKFGANGAHQWSKVFGDPLADTGAAIRAVAFDGAGGVAVAGHVSDGEPLDLGAGTLPGTGGAFVAAFGANGSLVFAKRASAGSQDGRGVAFDDAGNVIFAGETGGGSLDLGDGPSAFAGGIFLVQLSPAGAPIKTRLYGDADTTAADAAVATDASGNILFAGSYFQDFDDGYFDFSAGNNAIEGDTGGLFATKLSP